MSDTYSHRPVLLDEAIGALNIQSSGIYVDGTFGRGGHTSAILNQLGEKGQLFAMDKDPQAVATAKEMFADDARFSIEQGSFSQLKQHLAGRHWLGKVNGILLDLGVSSPQLDDAQRGFSFRLEGVLDMRMDTTTGVTAGQWINEAKETALAQVFRDYGEERYAKRIARAIVKSRSETPITTTTQLANIIAQAHPAWEEGKHPATRCFQAIRIFVNQELEDLQHCLPQALDILTKGGRLAVISFHSLEDRIVKRFIRDQSRGDHYPPDLPIATAHMQPKMRAVGKAIYPGEQEIKTNPRARSAVLRVAERT